MSLALVRATQGSLCLSLGLENVVSIVYLARQLLMLQLLVTKLLTLH